MSSWQNISGLSRNEIVSLQSNKLRNFITTQIYPFSPYYRRLFDKHKIRPDSIKTVSDLRRIPFTSKKDFLDTGNGGDRYRDFILQPDEKLIKKYWPAHKLFLLGMAKMFKGGEFVRERLKKEYSPVFLTFTTGRTTQPVPFLYTGYDISNLHISGKRIMELISPAESDRGVNMFPFAPHLAFWQVVFSGLAYNSFILSTGGGKTAGTEGNIRAVEKIKPSVIAGVPGFVYHVLRTASCRGCSFGSVKKIVLGAEKVPAGYKRKLISLLDKLGAHNVSIMGTYGFTEARCAWAECPAGADASTGYHLYPDKEIFEVIDPRTQEPAGEGEGGELVYTSIDSRGSSVIRYRTGDIVKGGIIYSVCPFCRRTVPRISGDITRSSNIKTLRLSKIKGSLVNLNTLAQILNSSPAVSEWQIEIRKKNNDPYEVDELAVYLAPAGEAQKENIEAELKRQILAECEISPNEINILPLADIVRRLETETSAKEKRIIDKRPGG